MSLINVDKLEKEYGGSVIFRGLTFSLEKGERIGLVGRNGCGKSTLLKIIIGTEDRSSGSVAMAKGIRLGYLPQKPPDLDDRSLWDFLVEVFDDLIQMEAKLDELAHNMTGTDESDNAHQAYSNLQHEFERLEGYSYESRIHKVLSGLGFTEEQRTKSLKEFSGGWRTRAYLARLLLEEPDILLLDEPTNHLDLDTVRWLEKFLANWQKSILVVSHDRFFLNSLCNRIWEMIDNGIEFYRGNYQQYQLLRAARFEERMKRWHSQQQYIDETQDFIRRNIAGQRTKEAQGRRKHLERFMKEEAISRPKECKNIHINFGDIERTGEQVLNSDKLEVGYNGTVVAEIPKLNLLHRRRLGIIGPNGCGKSTIVKTWLEELEPISGSFRFGSGVKPGYMSQTLTELENNLNLVDCIRQVQKQPNDAAARKLLGSLLFSGDDAFKTVGDLSGGERSRLAIARLALRGANLLFLDEPTNHLDIAAQELLQQILADYPGTLIFISHDRYLVQDLATELLIFENGCVEYFDGTLEDYRNFKEFRKDNPSEKTATPIDAEKVQRRLGHAEEKRKKNELKRLQRRFDQVEKEIHTQEKTKETLEENIGLASEAMDLERLNTLTADLQTLERSLELLFEEWEELGMQLE